MLVLALVAGVERPSRAGGIFLSALGALAAWTALSYVWSESPWLALEESQRVALYAVAAAAVVVNRRRLPVRGAVATAIGVVLLWNLVSDYGGNAPIGYTNSLAIVCVLGILVWWPLVVLAGPVLVVQHSSGAYAALVAGLLVYALRRPRWRLLVTAAAVGAMLASPFVGSGHERDQYWRAAVREAHAHPVLGSGAGTFRNWWLRDRAVPYSTDEAHSLYVETLAELGPLGLAFVLAAFAVPIAVARRREEAAVVAAYTVGAAVDFHWELAGATLPALLVAAASVSRGIRRRDVPLRVVVPACAVLAAAAVLAYAGSSALSAAESAAQRGAFAAAQADARTALRWQPYSPEPWLLLGDTAPSRAERVADYEHATRLDPAGWPGWQRLASVASGPLRRLAEAKAAQLNPLAAS